MNWDIVEGNWKQFSGKVKEQRGTLADDPLAVAAGTRALCSPAYRPRRMMGR